MFTSVPLICHPQFENHYCNHFLKKKTTLITFVIVIKIKISGEDSWLLL